MNETTDKVWSNLSDNIKSDIESELKEFVSKVLDSDIDNKPAYIAKKCYLMGMRRAIEMESEKNQVSENNEETNPYKDIIKNTIKNSLGIDIVSNDNLLQINLTLDGQPFCQAIKQRS